MEDTIRQVLQEIKNAFGVSIFNNPEQFKSALKDVQIATNAKPIRNLLDIAICDMQAYSRLESASNSSDRSFVLGNLISEMSSDYKIDKHNTQIVIECIAELLGYNRSNISRPDFEPPLPAVKPQPLSPSSPTSPSAAKKNPAAYSTIIAIIGAITGAFVGVIISPIIYLHYFADFGISFFAIALGVLVFAGFSYVMTKMSFEIGCQNGSTFAAAIVHAIIGLVCSFVVLILIFIFCSYAAAYGGRNKL